MFRFVYRFFLRLFGYPVMAERGVTVEGKELLQALRFKKSVGKNHKITLDM